MFNDSALHAALGVTRWAATCRSVRTPSSAWQAWRIYARLQAALAVTRWASACSCRQQLLHHAQWQQRCCWVTCRLLGTSGAAAV
jgi:hypothetical protein